MVESRPRILTRVLPVAAAVCVIMATASARQAEPQLVRGISGFQQTLRPEYRLQDLDVFDAELALDADQRVIVEALLQDYVEAFAEQSTAVGNQIQEIIVNAAPDQDDPSSPRGQYETLLQEASERAAAAESPEERERIVAEYQERIAQARETSAHGGTVDVDGTEDLRRRVDALVEPWRAARAELGATFVATVRPVLTDAQRDRWPSLERHLRRIHWLRDGKLAGERVDLVAMVNDVETDEDFDRTALDPLLDTYASELDAALQVREAVIAAGSRGGAAKNALDQEIAARIGVRDVNFAWIEQFIAALPEASGATLRTSFNKATFPLVERRTPTARLFTSVAKRIASDAERLEVVESLRVAYESELASENDEIRVVIRAHDPERLRRRLSVRISEAAGEPGGTRGAGEPGGTRGAGEPGGTRGAGEPGGAGGPPPVDPIHLAFEERERLDDRYADQLAALLTEEELAAFPALQRGSGGRPAGVRNGLERQQWVMEQFDADGDGRLNAEELEAVRAHLREQR